MGEGKYVGNFLPTVIHQIAGVWVVSFFFAPCRCVHAQFIAVREFFQLARICLIPRDCAIYLEKYAARSGRVLSAFAVCFTREN